jgi:hypothetical protein
VTLLANAPKSNLPRFTDSPAIRWFGHLIPEDGIIDAVDARILWNVSPRPIRIHDVAVFYWPKHLAQRNEYLCSWMYDLDDDLRYSSGNVYSTWDEDHIEMLGSLIKDFYYFTFLNDAEAQRAREEFARIRECEWARDPSVPMPPSKPWTEADHQALKVQKAEAQAEAEKRSQEPKTPLKARGRGDIKLDLTAPAKAEAERVRQDVDLDDDWNPDDHTAGAWAKKDVSDIPHVNFTGMTDG